MATPFNQGAPTIPVVLNTSNCFVFGNTASGNALSVQQLGTGNVATFRTTTGATALFVNAAGNVGIGTVSPSYQLSVATGLGATATPTVHIADTVGPKSLSVIPNASSGVYNAMVATGDTLLVAGVGTTVNTGVLTLAPWSGSSVGARIGGSSNIFGIYSNATTFYSNAVSPAAVMTVTNGRVGIGTTNPQTTLQVSGPANTATNRTTPYANAFVSVTNDIFYGTTGQVGLEIGSGTRASGDNDRVYKYVLNTINNATVGAGVDFQILGVPTAPASYTSDGTARNRMTIRYDGNVGIGTSSPGLSLSVNGSVNLGAAYYTGNFNTKTGPFILQASGFDAVGTTHTIAYSSFQGSVNGDNLGGIMIIIGKNLSASGKAACMTLSIAKRAGAYTYVQTINNNAVGLSTFSVSISSNDIIITSDSDMAITWTFIAGV